MTRKPKKVLKATLTLTMEEEVYGTGEYKEVMETEYDLFMSNIKSGYKGGQDGVGMNNEIHGHAFTACVAREAYECSVMFLGIVNARDRMKEGKLDGK